MDKNKRQIIILICLLAFIANYSIYTYYINPRLQKIIDLKKSYEQKLNKLNSLEKEKASIHSLKENVSNLKVESEKLDDMAPREIDTPKLIYDFYNFCRLYGVTGDSIKFQLEATSETENNNENTDTNNNNNSEKNSDLVLVSLTIDLSIKGNKQNIGNMLNNLNSITDRKLNVKNIVLAPAEMQQSEEGHQNNNINGNSQDVKIPNNVQNAQNEPSVQGGNGVTITNLYEMMANITFVQYIQISNKSYEQFKSYPFFDENDKGFGSFSEMFK